MSQQIISMLLNVFLLTVILASWFRPVAVRLGLVDHPDARKRHERPTPLCGGLAIIGALGVVYLINPASVAVPPAIIVGLAFVTMIGVADDRWGLRPIHRLTGQAAAAILIVAKCGFGTTNLGVFTDMHSTAGLVVGALVAVSLVVGLTNSLNLIDGVDGLAGLVAFVGLFWLSMAASTVGAFDTALHAGLMMAGTAGFLFLNLRHAWQPRALVFLGDGGSTMLGAALACLVLTLAAGTDGIALPSLLWLVAVPVIDTLSLVVRRTAAGRSPFAADRRHLHHVLLDRGLSPDRVTLMIAATSAVCGGIGYAMIAWQVPALGAALLLALPVAAHTALVLAPPDLYRASLRRLVESFARLGRRSGMPIAARPSPRAKG